MEWMNSLEVILPVALLLLAFLLKLAIDRNVDIPIAIQSLCELPVDIVFLSISFAIAYTISDVSQNSEGLLYCFTFLIISVLVVLIWRKSIKLFDSNNKWWILLLSINLFLSTFVLITSIGILIPDKIDGSSEQMLNEKNDDGTN